jgi:glycosyltransferase involved in cell wall biosynthesis
MRILAVHPHDPTNPLEPWTIRVVNLCKELRRLGHDVRLVCFRFPGCDSSVADRTRLLSREPRALLGNVGTVARWAQWADVVHIQKCLGHAAAPAVVAAYARRKPLHYDWDDWEEGIQREHRASRWMTAYVASTERLLPRLADTVSVSSDALRTRCLRMGMAADRICKVPVGADLGLFRPDSASEPLRSRLGLTGDVVIYVGQLHGSHDAALLLKAAKLVLATRPDVTFLIVGEGATRAGLQDMAESLGLAQRVRFLGAVPHEEIPSYLALASVAVASLAGGEAAASKSPLKVAEYLAAGKAIVATDVGEARAMVDGCGVLVPPGDELAMARAILGYLGDPSTGREDGARARRRAEETYNWAAGARTLERAYRCALGLSD